MVALIALGCSASGIKSGTGGTADAGDDAGTGGVTGVGVGDDGGVVGVTDGPTCGMKQIALEKVPPDLMIVLDKSGSMLDKPDGTRCGGCAESKWAQITAAIDQVVMATDSTIRWGIEFFPNDESCAVEMAPAAPIADSNAGGVSAAIAATNPEGGTPTRAAIKSASLYEAALTDPNPKYVLLATDGFPNCVEGAADDLADDSPATIQAVMDSAARGIPVFVVGIGTIPQATATLTSMAIAGGAPQAADPRFYPVSSTADLVGVLGTIGGTIGSCAFGLGGRPPDPENIAVVVDGAKIPRDPTHAEGWDYGTGQMSVQLYGRWCDDAKAGKLKDAQAIFGCPGVVIP